MPLSSSRRLSIASLAIVLAPAAASAQYIAIKTLPLAQADQFSFLPSANDAMGGVSIALRDSLHDPFTNPANGARVHAMRFFGSPTFYSISRDAGGGQTFPIGGLAARGNLFGGAVLAVQQLEPSRADQNIFAPPGIEVLQTSFAPSFPVPQQGQSKTNRYAYATLGGRTPNGFSVAGSVMYADLHRIDGVDQLYAGSQSVAQSGGDFDARLGMLRDWASGASVEALVFHDRLSMTHDVTFAETFYDPNLRSIMSRPRGEQNLERTNTWGMHLGWQQPMGDSGWRVGAFVTGNLLTHPKLPNYQIVDVVRPVPWDPGHSAAYNIGVGVAQHRGPSMFALDVVYEPMLTHTWGEAPGDLETVSGLTIPQGGKTTENHFVFSNIIARFGVLQDFPIDGVSSPLRLQGGIAAHSVRYWLNQVDHVAETSRRQAEHWLEWTPTWGVSMRIAGADLRYVGRVTHGTGRPGISTEQVFGPVAVNDAAGSNILAAPSGPLTLTPVTVTTHQLSLSVPLP